MFVFTIICIWYWVKKWWIIWIVCVQHPHYSWVLQTIFWADHPHCCPEPSPAQTFAKYIDSGLREGNKTWPIKFKYLYNSAVVRETSAATQPSEICLVMSVENWKDYQGFWNINMDMFAQFWGIFTLCAPLIVQFLKSLLDI